jgi:hypothetical protein
MTQFLIGYILGMLTPFIIAGIAIAQADKNLDR